MNSRYRGLLVALAVLLVLVGLTAACTKKGPDAMVSVAGVTNLDSLTLRDNLIVGKASTLGSGGLAVTGNFSLSNGSIINTKGAVTVTDGLNVTSQVNAGNGLAVAGYVTMSTGALVNSNGAVSVTDGLDVSSQIVGQNGLKITGGMTLSASGDLVMAGGNIWDDTDDVDVLDDMQVSGKLTVDSQLVASNGIAATGGITGTGPLSVTNWGGMYGLYLPAASQVVTASYGITPTDHSLILLADDGGQATGTIDLDGTVGIVNGSKVGQLLIIVWNDSDGASLKVADNSNVQFPANKYLTLAYLDAATFMWHGTDWVYLGGGTLN